MSTDSREQLNHNESDNVNSMLSQFIETMGELLSALHETFPECDKVRNRLQDYNTLVKPGGVMFVPVAKKIIRSWHKQLSPHYSALQEGNVQSVLESKLPMLEELDIKTKWEDPDFDQESRNNLQQYISTMNYHARLYNSIPPTVMTKIETMARSMVTDMSSDTPSAMDFGAMMQIGKKLVDEMQPEEMNAFIAQMGDMSSLMQMSGGMLSQMNPSGGNPMEMLGGLLSGGGGMGGMGGLLQMASFMGALPPSEKPKKKRDQQ
jgi:hypothetical protein